jgi:hypothetical protein
VETLSEAAAGAYSPELITEHLEHEMRRIVSEHA